MIVHAAFPGFRQKLNLLYYLNLSQIFFSFSNTLTKENLLDNLKKGFVTLCFLLRYAETL
jgi:hypothetical protein